MSKPVKTPAKPAPTKDTGRVRLGGGAVRFAILAGLFTVAACSGSTSVTTPPIKLSATESKDLAIFCSKDKVMSPIASAVLGALVPEAAPALTLNELVLHPVVVKFCAAEGGVAVIAPVTVAASVVVTPKAP